ncbi:ATP-dependent DNA helicase UvrD2 [Tessaracoccus sp. OS52]|uniref:ATP-dependent DNA helicase UvrD2 n=1 Tax=Tessaracoccus sp. OS52 TaxID=2886691 RepID=UPI001D114FC0|nr:ATP-dependent DNA helicase UvrD2 [Tessaracoccus sp. OS52]
MTDPILDVLDPEQLRVATLLEHPLVVLAGAGTGKTRAITHRVANAVREGRYSPTATLAVTFTTRAAGEMRTRLAGLGVRGAQARTIHAAALRQCKYFWPAAFHSEFPPVADNTFSFAARAANAVLGNADTALIRDLEAEISWAKSSNVAPSSYAELAGPNSREVNGASPTQVAAVMVHYEKAKSAAGQVDFNDVLLCAASLLAEHPAIAETIRDQYRHFIVDEYQDVSALQHRLIALWVDGRDDVCVVGDPNQAIHSFAGARADFLLGFATEFPQAEQVRLVRNYRSTPEILVAANKVLRVRPSEPTALRPTRGSGPAPSFPVDGSEAQEAGAVADWFKGLHAGGTPWSEMAVLYRINAQAPTFEAAFTDAGIPYSVRGTDSYYERAEVRQAVHVISSAAERDPEGDPVELVESYLSGTGWTPDPPSGMGRQRERWESLNALRDMVVAEAESQLAWTSDELRVWLAERAAWQASPVADSVTLSTMHAAKGLEWDAVAVVGVREGLVPFALSQEEPALSEERRLLHVALTRARTHLRVSHPQSPSRGKGIRSRFLDGIAPGRDSGPSAPRRSSRASKCSVCALPLATAMERKLSRHVDCEVDYDEELLEALKAWRKETAATASVPAFVVFTDATLRAMAEAAPRTEKDLLSISGVGRVKVDRYGDGCLAVIDKHLSTSRQ